MFCVCGYIRWIFCFVYCLVTNVTSPCDWSVCNLILLLLCCCCLPTPPCLFGGVLSYLEVTRHPVPVSSLGFKCPDCLIWNCSYIVYPSKMKGPFRDNCLRYYYLWLAFLMVGWVEVIRIELVLGLMLITGTAIE